MRTRVILTAAAAAVLCVAGAGAAQAGAWGDCKAISRWAARVHNDGYRLGGATPEKMMRELERGSWSEDRMRKLFDREVPAWSPEDRARVERQLAACLQEADKKNVRAGLEAALEDIPVAVEAGRRWAEARAAVARRIEAIGLVPATREGFLELAAVLRAGGGVVEGADPKEREALREAARDRMEAVGTKLIEDGVEELSKVAGAAGDVAVIGRARRDLAAMGGWSRPATDRGHYRFNSGSHKVL